MFDRSTCILYKFASPMADAKNMVGMEYLRFVAGRTKRHDNSPYMVPFSIEDAGKVFHDAIQARCRETLSFRYKRHECSALRLVCVAGVLGLGVFVTCRCRDDSRKRYSRGCTELMWLGTKRRGPSCPPSRSMSRPQLLVPVCPASRSHQTERTRPVSFLRCGCQVPPVNYAPG